MAISVSVFNLNAAPGHYIFCVSGQHFDTFKAEVTFRAIDFGEMAAREMLFAKIHHQLGEDISIKNYHPNNCPCKSNCPKLQLTAEQLRVNNSSIMGSMAEMVDVVAWNTKELFSNPGGFLKDSAKKLFGIKD